VLEEILAVVTRFVPVDVHGVRFVDLTVNYEDGTSEDARLGQESVPAGLTAGDKVLVSRAINMIVALRST